MNANTVAGYVNVYQVRVVTSSGTGGGSVTNSQYWESDIMVNPGAGTWVEVFPVQGSNGVVTQTVLAAAPASATATQQRDFYRHGNRDRQHSPGWFGGILSGWAEHWYRVVCRRYRHRHTHHVQTLPSAPHGTSLTATFTPSNTSSYAPSTSSALKYTVNPIAVKPTLSGLHRVGAEKCTESGLDFGVKASYTWLVNGKKVATGGTYTVAGSAYKKALTCSVAVHDGTGRSSSATSKAVTVSLWKGAERHQEADSVRSTQDRQDGEGCTRHMVAQGVVVYLPVVRRQQEDLRRNQVVAEAVGLAEGQDDHLPRDRAQARNANGYRGEQGCQGQLNRADLLFRLWVAASGEVATHSHIEESQHL